MIYFDHFATTPCSQEVVDQLCQYLQKDFGNSGSSYALGQRARRAVEGARAALAELLSLPHRSLCFTSGATEANNLLIQGLTTTKPQLRVISQQTEHPAVLAPLARFARQGGSVELLPVGADGRVDPACVEETLRSSKAPTMVCLMQVNNELGVCQPIEEVGALCQKYEALFHIDGAQAVGKVRCDPSAAGASSFALSAHKFYGPKGIGALYVRRDVEAQIEPLFVGGGQERGLRPGTAPVHQIVGLGAAAVCASRALNEGIEEILSARLTLLLEGLRTRLPSLQENGASAPRVPGGAHFTLSASDAEDLEEAWLGEVAFSRGAA
ncbi:MAG: cysteine desulfurase family protein, partial [Myxococcota bacterium]|nr:cysteine desulfurase family protein [Myxococcota bacterium]